MGGARDGEGGCGAAVAGVWVRLWRGATGEVVGGRARSWGRGVRLRGKGVHAAKKTGDLLVTVQVAVPRRLSAQARTALEAFDAAMEADPRETLRQEAAT